MSKTVEVHVVRVMCLSDTAGGEPVGIVLDGAAVEKNRRQALAAELGYGKTIFVDDVASGVVEIYKTMKQLPFAGFPLAATSWLLRRLGQEVSVLRPSIGEVLTGSIDDRAWTRGDRAWLPDFTCVEIQGLERLRRMDLPERCFDGTLNWYTWAWRDESAGIAEGYMPAPDRRRSADSIAGVGAVRLAFETGRDLQIHHGEEMKVDVEVLSPASFR